MHDADLLREINGRKSGNYHKSSDTMKEMLRPLLGNGLLLSEDDFWKQQRALCSPGFHFATLKEMVPMVVDAASECVAVWARDIEAQMAKSDGKPGEIEISRGGKSNILGSVSGSVSASASASGSSGASDLSLSGTDPGTGSGTGTVEVEISKAMTTIGMNAVVRAAFGSALTPARADVFVSTLKSVLDSFQTRSLNLTVRASSLSLFCLCRGSVFSGCLSISCCALALGLSVPSCSRGVWRFVCCVCACPCLLAV